jgi:hypothetical protein
MAAETERTEASRRFHALQAQGTALSLDERLEKLALADQLQDLERVLPGLQRAVLLEQNKFDIEAVVLQWEELTEAKRQAYTALFQAVAQMHQCYQALVAAHQQQEQAVGRLPAGVRERLSFPDTFSFERNFETRSGWTLGTIGPLTSAQLDAITDVDGGLRKMNPRMIQRFLEEAAKWNQRH